MLNASEEMLQVAAMLGSVSPWPRPWMLLLLIAQAPEAACSKVGWGGQCLGGNSLLFDSVWVSNEVCVEAKSCS